MLLGAVCSTPLATSNVPSIMWPEKVTMKMMANRNGWQKKTPCTNPMYKFGRRMRNGLDLASAMLAHMP